MIHDDPILVLRRRRPPKPSPAQHTHKLPGLMRRRRLGLREGAIVQCAGCGNFYEWTQPLTFDPFRWVKTGRPLMVGDVVVDRTEVDALASANPGVVVGEYRSDFDRPGR